MRWFLFLRGGVGGLIGGAQGGGLEQSVRDPEHVAVFF